ncbi:GNAT family N-acetyltransferase [Fredinandcohnia sp. QZ13]|uniref:GNAT family N-acetyltransferase n=1 Tax=Fredinandcohnia sp. QZ13 TaxID=3073144 RepID=UPI0028532BB7|nr:GNAT family N-acetyltransferase [Fredinandcohnia sp. QZ13]MDR4889920.1 GNAT family N-acetyltransferase [Fredinandcohnia sp. QZ13]
MAHEIRELKTVDEWKMAFPVMKQLRTHLTVEEFVDLVTEMQPQGYRLFALMDEGKVAAVTGVAQQLNLYYGKNMYVYDLVTDEAGRSKGYGEAILSYIHELARELGCGKVALTSGLQRVDAHRFYEDKMGYERKSYAFVREL